MSESFFSRWSRRKQEVREKEHGAERPVPPPQPSVKGSGGEYPTARSMHSQPLAAGDALGSSSLQDDTAVEPHAAQHVTRPAANPQYGRGVSTEAAPTSPPPTLEDVQSLTAQSDFTRFVAPDVAPEVKNAALKKLFADPHFNVMDGLDVYIDDYSKPDPLSPDMLKQLASAKFLRLFEEQPQAQEQSGGGPREVANNPAGQTVAQSDTDERPTAEEKASRDHADPDLRLQQDHAPGPPGTRSGSE